MLSFNQPEPIITHLPEIFHIVSILVATGPTFIRTSVHELVVNTIHALCTTGVRLTDDNAKKLYFVMNDISDSKNRVAFGLTKHHANAFTITKETTSDISEPINLSSLQNIIRLLLEAMTYGAPTTGIFFNSSLSRNDN
jgi:neurofibromin 1